MNKTDMVDLFRETLRINGSQAKEVVGKIFGTISDTLDKGEEVVLPGIGKLFIKERAARKGHNPRTGEVIDIKASRKLGVKIIKEFNRKLNP